MNVGIYCGIKKSRAAKSGSAFRYSLIKLMIFSEVCLTVQPGSEAGMNTRFPSGCSTVTRLSDTSASAAELSEW